MPMITEEREVIKLVQRYSGHGLVSLHVSQFANRDWLLIYRPGVVTRAVQPNSLLFAYDSLAHVQTAYEQWNTRACEAIEAWRAVTAACEPFPEGVLLTNRLRYWEAFWRWYSGKGPEVFVPLHSTYSPDPGTMLCRDLTLVERIHL